MWDRSMIAATLCNDIYKLSVEQLQGMFSTDKYSCLQVLKDNGSTEEVVRKLASEASTGIVGDFRDIKRRKRIFGENKRPLPQLPKLVDSIKQMAKEKIWLVVIGSALITSICGYFAYGLSGMAEGISIVIVTIFLLVVSTLADWIKDRQFVRLQSLVQEDTVTAIRGKFGNNIS